MLNRKATFFTPDLTFGDGSLIIAGRLWLENPPKYFEEIFLFTKKCESKIFYVYLNVEHVNSSTIKQLLEYFKFLKELKVKGKFEDVKVRWNILDDDAEFIDSIRDLENISELNIDIVI